ncbi:MAG: hypothetical protein AVDCRST_MAG93-10003, partial [uncultured Chloroflexia bacterium]
MKRVELQEGSEKTLTTTLLNSKPSFFREVCHCRMVVKIIGIIDFIAMKHSKQPEAGCSIDKRRRSNSATQTHAPC